MLEPALNISQSPAHQPGSLLLSADLIVACDLLPALLPSTEICSPVGRLRSCVVWCLLSWPCIVDPGRLHVESDALAKNRNYHISHNGDTYIVFNRLKSLGRSSLRSWALRPLDHKDLNILTKAWRAGLVFQITQTTQELFRFRNPKHWIL